MKLAFIGRAPEEYDEAFIDTMAEEYLRRTPWTQLRLAAVEDLVEPHPGDRVLDLGCAAGAITDFLSGFGCEVAGVDSEARAIERARELFPGRRFEQADVASLPFGDNSFDKAVAADLVEHLDDATFEAMLAECRRVLVPGGTLSLYTPNPRHLIERLKEREIILAQNKTHIGLRTSPSSCSHSRTRASRSSATSGGRASSAGSGPWSGSPGRGSISSATAYASARGR